MLHLPVWSLRTVQESASTARSWAPLAWSLFVVQTPGSRPTTRLVGHPTLPLPSANIEPWTLLSSPLNESGLYPLLLLMLLLPASGWLGSQVSHSAQASASDSRTSLSVAQCMWMPPAGTFLLVELTLRLTRRHPMEPLLQDELSANWLMRTLPSVQCCSKQQHLIYKKRSNGSGHMPKVVHEFHQKRSLARRKIGTLAR